MKHFLIETQYTAPLSAIEAATPAHRTFLQTGYDQGTLLLSGPQNPRTGGVILAKAESLETLQSFMAQDPFLAQKLATYRFVEFIPVKFQPALKDWLGA